MKLTHDELKKARSLMRMLRDSGYSYETNATIVEMRLSYLKKFSTRSLEIVFEE